MLREPTVPRPSPKMLSRRSPSPVDKNRLKSPPAFVEYAYYAVLVYSVMAVAWGIAVSMVGAGTLALLSAYCVVQMGLLTILRLIAFPLGCAVSFLLVQLVVHGEALVRDYVTWIFVLVIVQSLCFRAGFIHRFARVTFGIGLLMLPFLTLGYAMSGEVERAGLSGGIGFGDSNGLAAWFAFCVVYFFILGMMSKDLIKKIVSWSIAALCLGVVGLTVSRGSLLAVAMALTVAVRGKLKSAFLPLMMLMFIGWIAYELGVFQGIVSSYATRGTEESGRLLVWPAVIERFLHVPLFGVGQSGIDTWAPGSNIPISPHNGFLYIALASGIIPLIFFVAYWWKASRLVFQPTRDFKEYTFILPLLVVSFITVCLSNDPFMYPWVIVTLSTSIWTDSYDKIPWASTRRVRIRRPQISRGTMTSETRNQAGYQDTRHGSIPL